MTCDTTHYETGEPWARFPLRHKRGTRFIVVDFYRALAVGFRTERSELVSRGGKVKNLGR